MSEQARVPFGCTPSRPLPRLNATAVALCGATRRQEWHFCVASRALPFPPPFPQMDSSVLSVSGRVGLLCSY